MQVVKGEQDGCPVPGGTAGPPCPGGYKCGELALQVGGWANCHHKKLTVRDPELWPRNSQTEWKGITDMRVAICSVHTLKSRRNK